METEAYTVQDTEVVEVEVQPFYATENFGLIAVAVVSALASVLTVALQMRGAAQNKKESDKHTEQTEESTDDIKKLIKENTTALNNVNENLQANSRATVANARASLRRIYNQLAPRKKISVSDKAMVMELYNAYKGIKMPDGHVPNGFCDAAVKDIETWDIVPDGECDAK